MDILYFAHWALPTGNKFHSFQLCCASWIYSGWYFKGSELISIWFTSQGIVFVTIDEGFWKLGSYCLIVPLNSEWDVFHLWSLSCQFLNRLQNYHMVIIPLLGRHLCPPSPLPPTLSVFPSRAHIHEEQTVYLLNVEDNETNIMCGAQIGLSGWPKSVNASLSYTVLLIPLFVYLELNTL